jgi:hypothetical protein
MGQATRHHPGPWAAHIKELSLFLPPRFVLLTQSIQSFAAILCITSHELQTSFLMREGWSTHINAQHVAKPEILAHTLMDHLLVHTAASRIILERAHVKILIRELTPDTDHFDAFGFVCLNQEIVSHNDSICLMFMGFGRYQAIIKT